MAIAAERLREGTQILVAGEISFSRLARLVDGEALTRSIAQAKARGQLYPTLEPHTTINLVNASVLFADAANKTQEELYAEEKIYPVKSGDNAGKLGFSLDNKSTFLPTVLEQDPDNPGQYRQLELERDLATGVKVIIVLQVFKPKGYEKRGLGLQQIVLQEPVRYFASAGADTSALAARGIIVNGGIKSIAAADSTAAATPLENVDVPANSQVDASGFPAPMPGAVGTAPVANIAAAAFPVSAPVAAPAAPVAQAPVAAAPAAAPVLTAEQQIAQLTQQIAERDAAAAASGGASAFGAAPAAAEELGPWSVGAQAAAVHQG